MTWLLRDLRLLITSRYHAAILSLSATIPQIGLGHDLRLSSLYDELGLLDSFFLRPTSSRVFGELNSRIDLLMTEPNHQADALTSGFREHLERARENRGLLRSFLADHGWEAERWAA